MKNQQQKRNSVLTETIWKTNREILYWMALLILIVATLLISMVLIPVILVIEPFPLYAFIILLGVMVGSVFAVLLRDITGLQVHHHAFALLFLPGISVLNLLIITTIATKVAVALNIPQHADPVFVAVVYVLSFLLPYFLVKDTKL